MLPLNDADRRLWDDIDSSGWIQNSPRMNSHEDDLMSCFKIKHHGHVTMRNL